MHRPSLLLTFATLCNRIELMASQSLAEIVYVMWQEAPASVVETKFKKMRRPCPRPRPHLQPSLRALLPPPTTRHPSRRSCLPLPRRRPLVDTCTRRGGYGDVQLCHQRFPQRVHQRVGWRRACSDVTQGRPNRRSTGARVACSVCFDAIHSV